MPTHNGELKLFAGSAHPALAQEIADRLGGSLGRACLKRFSDGEVSFQIDENIRGTDVFVLQPTCRPVDEHLVELCVMIDAFRPFVGFADHGRYSLLRIRKAGPERQTACADHRKVGRQSARCGRRESRANDGPSQGADPRVL